MSYVGFPVENYNYHQPDLGPTFAGLIVRDIDGYPLTGIMPSKPDLVKAGSGWNVIVSPFIAVRRRDRDIIMAGSSGVSTVEMAPAPSANSRIDVIYTLPADPSTGYPLEAVRVATGVPGAVPAKPSIPAGASELATFTVGSNASGASSAVITNTFRTTVCSGGVVPFRTVQEMESFSASPGQLAISNGVLYHRVGSSWVKMGATKSGVAVVNTGTLVKLGSSTNYGKSPLSFIVPVVLSANERLVSYAFNIGNGWGTWHQSSVTPSGSNSVVEGRFSQLESAAAQSVHIYWEVVTV